MKEIKRLKVMEMIRAGQMTRAEAAEKLQLSERQVYRIQHAYREKGEQGLVHGNRGKASHRRVKEKDRTQIIELLEGTYQDYNTLHFQEVLEEKYGVKVSYGTLQTIRKECGHPTPRKKKKRKHRSRRPRRPIYGMMLQGDASIHDWLEGRGPRLALISWIDDATNWVWAIFREYEDAAGYLEVLQQICLTEGIPMQVYTDRRNVFQDPRQLSIDEQLAGKQRNSHFKEVLDRLGIELIQANSPQAKGRVERLFETLQDRLVKALREAGAFSLQEANAVLQTFLPEYNRRFHKKAAQENSSAFVPWEPSLLPYDLFCFRYTRTVRNDNTISFGNTILQIPPGKHRRHFAKAIVELRQHLDCVLTVHYHGVQIASFAQAQGFPLRIGAFIPLPEEPGSIDFVPEPIPSELIA